MKKKDKVGVMKQSKSTGDIIQGILDLKDDFCCIQSRLGTRSLSHDSIFWSEQCQSDPEPPGELSQEHVLGKIQALQMKLQMQKMHLGPPPLVLPTKQPEDHQPQTEVQWSNNLPHKGDLHHPISTTLPALYSSAPSSGVDFSTLPQFIPCLDNSAARHRMSIKPRNQRASTKSRRKPTIDGSRPRSETIIILDRPLTESIEEDGVAVTKEMARVRFSSSQIIRPGKGFTPPLIKRPSPTSPLKSQVQADDSYNSHAVSQCKGKEEPAASTTTSKGTKQILKSAEGMVVKRPSSAGPTNHNGSGDHKEALHSSKLKSGEVSAMSGVSSVYTPCLILSGSEQPQLKTDKEFNTVTTHAKQNAPNRVQDTEQEHYLQGQSMKPLSLHRNTDNKYEDRNVHQASPVPLSSGEGCLQESINQQRSLSFSVSSDKSHERQRTRSFTEQNEEVGRNREHVLTPIKSLSHLKTHDLHKNVQVWTTVKDSSQTGASTRAVSPRLTDRTITVSPSQEKGYRLANKIRDLAEETQMLRGVEEADEVNKRLKMNKVSKEQNEERSASEVKLHTMSQSGASVKHHNTEVRNNPWSPESTTPIRVSQNVSKVGPINETCTVTDTKLSTFDESPDIQPQIARRDRERAGLNQFPDLQASAQLSGTPLNISVSTPECVVEKNPLQTGAKEPGETSTELSWMTLAREKTRRLQELFTSTLSDLAGLQTATRPAAAPFTQTSSQPRAGPLKHKHQMPSAQASVSQLETTSTIHASVRPTHPTQPPILKSMSLAQPSISQPEGTDFSFKQSLSLTGRVQPTHFSARPGKMSSHSPTKSVQLSGICISPTQFHPQLIHEPEQQLSQMSIYQAQPLQQSLPQSVTKPLSSQALHQSLSSKLTPHQAAHQPASPGSQSMPLGEALRTSISQGRSPAKSTSQYAGEIGSKASLTEQNHLQNPDAIKVVDQKSVQESPTCQSLDEYLSISSHSKLTELAVSPGSLRLDQEVKYQKRALPPPSPSTSSRHQVLESNSDGRQPSWMELAKRKSMAWSDKSMD